MTNIKVHRNVNVDWPRYHTEFYTNFINKILKHHFFVEEINHAIDTHGTQVQIDFPHHCGALGKQPLLYDVDCVIENLSTNKFVVMSFTEYFNHGIVHYLRNNSACEKMLLVHFNPRYLYDRLKSDGVVDKYNIVSPWFFGSFIKYDILKYRSIRHNITKKNGLVFRGSGIDSYRKTLKYFIGESYFIGPGGTSHDQYMRDLCSANLALSHYVDLDIKVDAFQHCGEYCYRDMEYLSIGLPFIRIEYTDTLYNNLIPGKHYIAIPREEAWFRFSEHGHTGLAVLYKEYYDKFKGDIDYLRIISANQIEWYDKNCMWPASGDLTWDLLNLNSWK